jgi:uncharacterized protein involved in exopolysaccharide biosynthesis
MGAHNDDDVFNRNDQHEGPDDQRQRAQDRLLTQIPEIDERLEAAWSGEVPISP